MRLTNGQVRDLYRPFSKEIENMGYEYRSNGCFRNVYHRKGYVIKIPKSTDGVVDNIMEARAYSLYKNAPTSRGIYLAPCKLLPNLSLLMVFVRAIRDCEYPSWAEEVEGEQIGFYKNRPVAFDYALDLAERYAWEQESVLKSIYYDNEWKDVKPELYPEEVIEEYKKSLQQED